MREHDGYPVGARVRVPIVTSEGELFGEVTGVIMFPAQRSTHPLLGMSGRETGRVESIYGQGVEIVESELSVFPVGKKIFVPLSFIRPLHAEAI